MVAAAEKSKVLVSGFGSIGRRHFENLTCMRHGVLSFDPHVRPRPLGGVASFTDGLELSTHVLIASPAKFHAKQAIQALEAGKEVFIEKPMAMDVKEGEAIMSAAKAAGKTVAVGYQWRAYKPTRRLLAEIGSIAPIHAELIYTGDRSQWPGSCYDDLLLECSHELDLLRLFFPKHRIKVIDAIADSDRADIRYMLTLNDVSITANVRLDWASVQKVRSWTVYGGGRELSVIYDERNPEDVKGLGDAYRSEIESWLEGKPVCIGEDGLVVLRDIERIRELAKR